ncbi:MAG TPA: hypothetical protein VJQ61_08310 [Sinomonas sp.]|nr:hypothetical protein [Sinomonas sp.]
MTITENAPGDSELVDRHIPLTELPGLFMNGEEGDTIKSVLDLTSENA